MMFTWRGSIIEDDVLYVCIYAIATNKREIVCLDDIQ